MGSEQSTPSGSSKPSSSNQDRQVLDSPSRVLLSREGALSPRQDSVCSESDAPYVPYTVNKPIGDSPKKTDKSKSKFSSPRLRRANDRLSKSALNTLVTVNKLRISDELKYDEDLIKLQEIPAFLPIMQGSLEGGGKGAQHLEILSRLDSGPLNCILQRYEDHLRSCAARVAADQGAINKKIKDVEDNRMTLYHFANCLALAYTPYYLTYKYAGLAEYGAFWKVGTAGVMYMLTQLAKMMFLATFFPMPELEEEEAVRNFDLVHDFFRATVDIADLVGIYLVMQRISGKGSVKILVAGLGWAMAELILTRLVFLWVGARGVEFDWRYIQKSLDANISLVHFITLACLVWTWTRKDTAQSSGLTGVLSLVLAVACYKGVLVSAASHYLQLGTWTTLAQDGVASFCLGLVSLQIYLGVTNNNEKY